MTSVESAEENQIVKLQMGDGDSAISQESNLDIEMTQDPAAVHRKGQQKTNMAGTKEKPDHAPNLDELIQNFDRALSHPDNEDLDRLEEIIRRDLKK